MTRALKQPLVLMYHGIVSEWTVTPESRETGAELYDVKIADFRDQMQWLKDHKYHVKVFREGQIGTDEYATDVILTFDDGEMNNCELALPVLQQHGFPAYFFIIAARVGRQGYMGWEELKRMHEAGMVIGSHGFSHEILTGLLDTQIEEELTASKKYLERNLNFPVDTLSIPRGFCDDKIIQMAYDAGYKRIFISDRPRAMTSECYSRVGVKATWMLKRFVQALEGKMPLQEKIIKTCIRIAKRVVGGGIYNWIRKTLLRI